jgi:streptomycin 6-kinase
MPNSLDHYIQTWNLSDPQFLVETHTSYVYLVNHLGTQRIFKLLTPLGIKDEHTGTQALRYWDGHGAVHLLRADDKAVLLEYASGDDLIPMVRQGNDEGATGIMAEVLNQLHSRAGADLPDGVLTLREYCRSLFIKAEADRGEGLESIYTRAAGIAEELLAHPRDVCLLHGDMHHENVRFLEGRGWLAFDPKGLIGERTYDAANILCNPIDMPELVENEARLLRHVVILSETMAVDRSRLLNFVYAYACLSASWFLEDGSEADAQHDLAIARIVEPHLTPVS